MTEFRRGDRVRLSIDGKQKGLYPRRADRGGVIVSDHGKRGSRLVLVRWDGTKGVAALHPAFVELIDRAKESPSASAPRFRRGIRVRLSPLAHANHLFSKHPDRRGTVLNDFGQRGGAMVNVQWDGARSRMNLHPDFLEPDE